MTRSCIAFLIFSQIYFVQCLYSSLGEEVQPGSVLLPASRRGRYLANIVRRQAIDGTGLNFNKVADRMNADAKKKVDVLSEELLPYIIAEQERRTTLYKRVMTAIQNGEKGVTIAEIRNKPPAIIRKGLIYRCPSNRAPREPDGSGIIMCEGDIEPTPIVYESCLCAEDKELFVADNKYFFCNRHKVEGPDLPRNGTTVIGCAPPERTSLNYTSQRCALEDTDDVVVHYRYYPDRTYTFVNELDPEREVCEHWNPCQVGYIFSLPGPDQATAATELWHDSENYFEDEIVPPVSEDNKNETGVFGHDYQVAARLIEIPKGFTFEGVGKYEGALRSSHFKVISTFHGSHVRVALKFIPFTSEDVGTYYAKFHKVINKTTIQDFRPLVTLSGGGIKVELQDLVALPGQNMKPVAIDFTCNRCVADRIMIMRNDRLNHNMDLDQFRVRKYDEKSILEIDVGVVSPQKLGDYLVTFINEAGNEDNVLALILRSIDTTVTLDTFQHAGEPGKPITSTVVYNCKNCSLSDIGCNGESMFSSAHFTHNLLLKTIAVNFPEFSDDICCAFMGTFKDGNKVVRKLLGVIEMVTVQKVHEPAPDLGSQHSSVIPYTCTEDCTVARVTTNGIPVEMNSTTGPADAIVFADVAKDSITIRFSEFSSDYEGVYLGTFFVNGQSITKILLEIGEASTSGGGGDVATTTEASGGAEEPKEPETPPEK